jgi:predicted HTH transcriptional regulator
MAPTGAVAEAAELLRARLRELDSERAKLERALASLTDGREGKRGPGRPRGAATATTSRRRRRRRGGTRADHAAKLITEKPGITASEIARELKIKPNYMYRVLSDLQKDGKVRKDGRAYHPA